MKTESKILSMRLLTVDQGLLRDNTNGVVVALPDDVPMYLNKIGLKVDGTVDMSDGSVGYLLLDIDTPIYTNKTLHIDHIIDYFKTRSKYRGMYYSYVKYMCIDRLLKSGFNTRQTARIVFGNPDRHDSVIHHKKHYVVSKHIVEVCKDWESWVIDKKYPISVQDKKDNSTFLKLKDGL